MKRILTLLAAIGLVMTAMAQTAGITLSTNNGEELIFFRADQFQQAIDKAQANDILYFAAGTYSIDQIDRKITKPLTLKGAGAQGEKNGGTTFTAGWSNLYIEIDPTLPEQTRNVYFEGIMLDDNVSEIRLSDGTILDELGFTNFYGSLNISNDNCQIGSLKMDRCQLNRDLNIGEGKVGKADISKTKIWYHTVWGSCSNSDDSFTLYHCLIGRVDNYLKGIVKNSLIEELTDDWNSNNIPYFQSCGFTKENWYNIVINKDQYCQLFSGYDIENLNNDPTAQPASCEDGSHFGTMTKENPFSLYPSSPTPNPAASTLSMDGDKIRIHVELLKDNATNSNN